MHLIDRHRGHIQQRADVRRSKHATQLRIPVTKPQLGVTEHDLPGADHCSPARTDTASGSAATSGRTDHGIARTGNSLRGMVQGNCIRVLRT